MQKYFVSFLLMFCLGSLHTFGQGKPNYLYKTYSDKGKAATLNQVDSIKLAQLKKINADLNQIPQSAKQQIIDHADRAAKNPWPILLLNQFNEFKKTGNRVNYENKYFARRNKFTALLIGEITERKGRYIADIADGLGLLMEESTWALPAHMMFQKAGVGLADVQDPTVDLFASQTGALLAWTRLLLKDELNSYSPQLVKRIDYELNRRIFEPYLGRDDFSWMGFRGGKMNNWNTFINTNVLTTALLAQDDKTQRVATIDKTIRSLDFFLDDYPADGGCDEGPSYWAIAGGALIQYLDLLNTYSNGQLDFSKNQLIHNIGTYIYKVHINYRYYVNFADAGAMNTQDPLKVYLFGRLFNDPQLVGFAAYIRQVNNSSGGYNLGDIGSFLSGLSADAVLNKTTPKAPQLQQSWLPDLQVLTVHQNEGSPKGLFFAAKGGHNNESHNHNDVGNFIIYKDGMPVIVDAGVGTYTGQTFGKDRYKLWFMQSGWHNCPVINGIEQRNGARFKANDVTYTHTKKEQKLSMNLAAAYPAEAEVNSWTRTFTFNPAKAVLNLNETYYLKKLSAPSELHFLVYGTITEESKGHLTLTNNTGQTVSVSYDPAAFDFKVDAHPIDDARLAGSWKTSLNRLSLIIKGNELRGNKTVLFE
jgi:hypothetical protein